MNRPYSDSFTPSSAPATYENTQFGLNSYWTALWPHERRLLRVTAESCKRRKPDFSYLDFACGTGRIVAAIEDLPARSVGIDVSPAMLDVARQRVQHATLQCLDIVSQPDEVAEQFDLITAFRFFLNVEPDLRAVAMRALALRLRDSDSLLVFNNHGNPLSFQFPRWLVYQLRGARFRANAPRRFLSHRTVLRLLRASGLQIRRTTAMGYFPRQLYRLGLGPVLARVEGLLSHVPALRPFGLNRVYVVSRPEGSPEAAVPATRPCPQARVER